MVPALVDAGAVVIPIGYDLAPQGNYGSHYMASGIYCRVKFYEYI